MQITFLAPAPGHPQAGSPQVQVSILLGELAGVWADTAFPTPQLTEELLGLLETALTAVNNHHRTRIAGRLLSEAFPRDRSRSPERGGENVD